MGFSKQIDAKTLDYLAVGLLFFYFLFLTMRGMGVLPSIMADEWYYSLLSRIIPLEKVHDPGYLYLAIYKTTNLCGSGYLPCARILNSLFYVTGCALVYLTARLFLPVTAAVGVFLIVLLAAESVYTVFFMPESLYFFLFWLFAYVVLSAAKKGGLTVRTVFAAGVVVGAATLVKPHALFVAAGMALYIMIAHWAPADINWRRRLRLAGAFVATVLTVKVAGGFLAVGPDGVTLFGSRYSSLASDLVTIDRAKDLVVNTVHVLANHTALLTFLYFAPIAGAIGILLNDETRETHPEVRDLLVFFALMLGTLLLVTAMFSASVAGANAYDNLARMHMRYYNFLMPLAVIASALVMRNPATSVSKTFIWIIGVAVLLGLFGAARVAGLLDNLEVNFVDSPGLMFLSFSARWRWLVAAFGLLLALLMLFHYRAALRVHLWAFIPLVFLLGTAGVQRVINVRMMPDAYDRAGAALAAVLSGRQDAQVTLFGPDEAALYKTVFYLDRRNSALRVVAPGMAIDPVSIPPGTTHALVFGDAEFGKPGFALRLEDVFRLYVKDDQ